MMEFDEYQRMAAQTAIYPEKFGITYPVLGLTNEAGEVAGKLKKMMRDEGFDGTLTYAQKALLSDELGDVLWYLSTTATEMGVSLSDIAESNLNKLHSRKARGVLGGSGDDR